MYPSMVPEATRRGTAQNIHPFSRDFPSPTKPRNLQLCYEHSPELANFLHEMRLLIHTIETGQHYYKKTSHTTLDMLDFRRMQDARIHRLRSLKIHKTAANLSLADHQIEICRLGALIFIKCALPLSTPNSEDLRNLKAKVLEHLQSMRKRFKTKAKGPQPEVLLWAQFVAGIAWTDDQEEDWIARSIARGARYANISNWAEMESRLRQICWMDTLHTPACKSLWKNIQNINKKYWRARIESMQQEWED